VLALAQGLNGDRLLDRPLQPAILAPEVAFRGSFAYFRAFSEEDGRNSPQGALSPMQFDAGIFRKLLSEDLTEVMIRVGLIAIVVVLCVRIFAPFMDLMLWALILAVALYPLHQGLARRLRGRQGRAATLIVLVGLLLIGVPTAMLGSSFAGQVHELYTAIDGETINVPPPAASVADWPLIGKKVYATWSAAAADLPALLKKLQPQLGHFMSFLARLTAGMAGAVLLFVGSLIIAGIMMAYGQSGSQAMESILCRLTGPVKGLRLHRLSTATIRSVASGVIGVAFIQALLLGVGFLVAGVPGAGVLAAVVMVMGILQLPALIVSLPVIVYLWWSGDASTAMNVLFTAYLLIAGFADNFLKPLLLGRGVDVPMPVILLGALGGMVSGGIIGLFVGAVLLAVGYQVFMDWVEQGEVAESSESEEGVAAETSLAGE
jgi:predicted PurR-regulated permease PerM